MIYYFDSHKRNPDVKLQPVLAEGKAIMFSFNSSGSFLDYMNRLHENYGREQFELVQIKLSSWFIVYNETKYKHLFKKLLAQGVFDKHKICFECLVESLD